MSGLDSRAASSTSLVAARHFHGGTFRRARQLTEFVLLLLTTLGMAFLTVACGGGGNSGGSGSSTQATSLAVAITDLPTATAANVKVTDPDGQIIQVTSSHTINAIPGAYTITAAPVVVGTSTYHATQTTQTVTVIAGATSTVTVDYYNIIPNTTKILDQTGAQSLIVSPDGTTLTISNASEVALSLQPGDVLVITPVSVAPNGLLLKVVTAANNGSSIVIASTPATFADEVIQARFGVDIPLVLTSKSAALRKHAGYEIRTIASGQSQDGSLANPCAAAAQSLSLPFNYSLPPDQNQNTLTASGELDFCNLHVDYDIRPLSTYAVATVSLQQYSDMVVQGQYSTSIDWSESLDLSDLETQVKCLGNETCQAVLGLSESVGNAAAIVKPVLTPFVGMQGSASGGLYLGGAEAGLFQAGLQVQGVTPSPVYSGTPQQISYPTAVDGTLDVKGYFGVTLGFRLLGSITFHVDPRAYAELKADTGANPWWTLWLGEEADAGLTLSFLGFGNSEHDTPEYTIYSGQLAQASGPYSGQPTLNSVTPDTAAQYSPSLTLSISGTNFVPGCHVIFNGFPLSTVYSDPTSLTALVPASLLGTAGLYSLDVSNSSITGTTSNTLSFTVIAGNPVPSISSLSPSSLAVGSASQTLMIYGAGFTSSSTVTFNGMPHAPTFVSAAQLSISLSASDLGTAGSFPVVVKNPQPGGGNSNTAELLVVSGPSGTVTISPLSASVPEGGLQTFSATVAGGGGVNWSVEEGSQGGTITSAGVYSAPLTTGTFHVLATNGTNSSFTATATVTVVPSLSPGIISTVAGGASLCAQRSDSIGDGCPATQAWLTNPTGVATDHSGNLYIADSSNNRVRVVNVQNFPITIAGVTIQPGTISTVAGNGAQGYLGDNGPPTSAELNAPGHLTLDATGNIFISDSYNYVVRLVNLQTGPITYAGVTIQPNTIATIAGGGTGCPSETDGVGDGCPATAAQMSLPDGIGLDRSNNLFIADFYGERIRRVDASTGVITTVAGDGYGGFSGDGGPATSAELFDPSRVSVDANGNLYISDYYNNRVRKVDALTGVISTFAGTGNSGYSGDGGAPANAEFEGPLSVVLDSSGNVYIADVGNQRIRVVNTQPSAATLLGVPVPPSVIATVVGDGSTGYSGDGGPATNATIDDPTGLWFDKSGNFYFADSLNGVIREVSGP